MKQRLLFILILTMTLSACPNENPTDQNNSDGVAYTQKTTSQSISQHKPTQNIQHPNPNDNPSSIDTTSFNGFYQDDYPISIRKISQAQFDELNRGNSNFSISIMPNDDFNSAKEQLKGIVDFNSDGSIKRIHFKNGGVIDNPEGRFVAYYGNNDDNKNILVLEGGHLIDISYNLNTGKSTEHVGNPNQASISSPNKQYRLIGHFGGQECSSYFIQKHINGEWVKIIELNDIFNTLIPPDEHSPIGLCYYDGSMFLNETHAYIIKQNNDNHQEPHTIYQIILKDDLAFKRFDVNIKPQPLSDETSIEIDVDFDNYQDIIPKNGHLNKEQAKFFAGLYPNAEEIYVLGLYHYQKDINSYVVSIKQSRDLLQTYLINIDKNHHIIDTLLISADGIRELDYDITAILQKEQIKVLDNNADEPNEVTYRIDDKGYFYAPKPY